MKYITHNDKHENINTNLTHLQGAITCTFAQLVATFGNPMKDGFDDYKSDAEWEVQFEDGTVATIYNYKNGKNYCGDQGQEVWEITQWNIGGHVPDAVGNVRQAVAEVQAVVSHDYL
jgi:hypothetical protein